jgi:hypothetical protein
VRYLVRLIDDATSRSWGRFVAHDGTRENRGVLWGTWNETGGWWTCIRIVRQCSWSFETDQDRLVKELRLAKVSTMQAANRFLEKEYWPDWNARFARSLEGVVDLHRPLTPHLDLAAALSHVEQRVIRNDYTVSFAGRSYQIGRKDVKAGMNGQRLRIELRLDGELRACYEGPYVELGECGVKTSDRPALPRQPVRKDHNDYHALTEGSIKTGTFYFDGNRNFLFCLDTRAGNQRCRTATQRSTRHASMTNELQGGKPPLRNPPATLVLAKERAGMPSPAYSGTCRDGPTDRARIEPYMEKLSSLSA